MTGQTCSHWSVTQAFCCYNIPAPSIISWIKGRSKHLFVIPTAQWAYFFLLIWGPPPLYCYVFYSLQNDRCVFKRQFKNITGNGLNTKLICFRLSGSSVRKCSKGPVYQVLLQKCCQKLSASLKLPVCSLGLWIRPSELKPINKPLKVKTKPLTNFQVILEK